MKELTQIKNKYKQMSINEKINFRNNLKTGKTFLEMFLRILFMKSLADNLKTTSIYTILK